MAKKGITEGCPFCKQTVADWDFDRYQERLIGSRVDKPADWYVRCLGCGARGPMHKTKVEAIDAWNDR